MVKGTIDVPPPRMGLVICGSTVAFPGSPSCPDTYETEAEGCTSSTGKPTHVLRLRPGDYHVMNRDVDDQANVSEVVIVQVRAGSQSWRLSRAPTSCSRWRVGNRRQCHYSREAHRARLSEQGLIAAVDVRTSSGSSLSCKVRDRPGSPVGRGEYQFGLPIDHHPAES